MHCHVNVFHEEPPCARAQTAGCVWSRAEFCFFETLEFKIVRLSGVATRCRCGVCGDDVCGRVCVCVYDVYIIIYIYLQIYISTHY